jgi:hypothetical protein
MKNHHHNDPIAQPSTSVQPVSHETIACRAQELWISHGRPENQDQEIWLEAESQLAAGQQKAPGQPAR